MRTVLGNCDPIGGFCTSVNESVCEALHKVSRPQGEWIIEKTCNNNYNYRCSYCNWYERHDYPDVKPYNFCPNCGADMRGAR